jgi:hypothetical protein
MIDHIQFDSSTVLVERDLLLERTYRYVVQGMHDDVAEAYEDRRKNTLPKLLKAFNKLQGIQFKKFAQNTVRNQATVGTSEI